MASIPKQGKVAATRAPAAKKRSDTPKPIDRPAALNELVLVRLRDDIVSGVFAFGEKLSEEQICRNYGVTRAPVRPSLIYLQSEGLIQLLPQRGAYVYDPKPQDVRALCELRTALELEAARLALARNRTRLAERLGGIVARMEPLAQAVTNPRYQQLDSDFHMAILEAATSELLLSAYRHTVYWRFAALRFRLAREKEQATRSFDEHRHIVDLVEKNDIAGLEAALRVHIENTNRYYESIMREQSAQDAAET